MGIFQPEQSNYWSRKDVTDFQEGPGLVVCLEINEELPVFCKISTIVVKDEQVVLIGSGVETICFDKHFFAFKVLYKPSQAPKVFSIQGLLYFKQMAYGSTDVSLFVVPYCHMMQP